MGYLYLLTVKFAALINACVSGADDGKCVNLPRVGEQGNGDPIRTALQVVFSIVGAVAVAIITFAAFKYVTAGDNPQNAAKARSTIFFAVIGLLVSLLAFSIVTFVIDKI